MFSTIVERKVEEVFNHYIIGEFYIGLEPIKEYVYFYCIASALQSKNHKYNLSEFQNKLVEENTDLEADSYDFLSDYDKVAHHYINMNHKTQLDYYERQHKEKQKGKVERLKGKTLYDFQKNEFIELMMIKSENKSNLNKTYKRIVSDKGYLSRMSFTEFKRFHDHLYNQINTEDPYSNIRYYKLEKMFNFELIKSILTSLSRCRSLPFFDEESVLTDLLLVTDLPLIVDRHRYVELYPELNWADMQVWKEEVQIPIITQIKYSIAAVQKEVQEADYNILDNVDWKKFGAIYAPHTFKAKK